MKKEDIKHMAKEVGFDVKWFEQSQPGYPALPREGMLFAFAELVAKAEREECAKVADIGNDPRPASNPERYLPGVNTASKLVAQDIAYKIRARSMK